MRTIELYLSFGSNLGDRDTNVSRALEILDGKLGIRHEAISEIMETEPWGNAEGGAFLNCTALYRIPSAGQDPSLHASALLRICKEVERMLGRTSGVEYDGSGKRRYRARPIDIDILLYGSSEIRTSDLTVPHMHMKEREFVMVPLRQIASCEVKSAFPEIFEVK